MFAVLSAGLGGLWTSKPEVKSAAKNLCLLNSDCEEIDTIGEGKPRILPGNDSNSLMTCTILNNCM